MKLRILVAAAAAIMLGAQPVLAQTVTVTTPNTVNSSGQPTTIQRTFVINADGSTGSTGNAPSATAASGVAPVASTAVSSGIVLKPAPGNLYGINVASGATAGYILLINAATIPADGAVTPAKCIQLAANTGIDLNYRATPSYFGTGIVLVFSTTGCFLKTASATAFLSGDAK